MLPIIHQDEHLIAVHKPAGLLVHRSQLARDASVFAVQLLRDQLGRRVYPAHRLDRGTSGVLVFAFDALTAGLLGERFAAGLVDKTYAAVVRGVAPEHGCIDHPLVRRIDEPGRTTRRSQAPPQPAVTRYRRIAECELPHAVDRYPTARYSLLALSPQQGRRHQLRRHLKHIAHPVIGDSTYGKGRHNRFFAEHLGCRRMLLACVRLRFSHPASGGPLDLFAAPATDFAEVAERLGWASALAALGDTPTAPHEPASASR